MKYNNSHKTLTGKYFPFFLTDSLFNVKLKKDSQKVQGSLKAITTNSYTVGRKSLGQKQQRFSKDGGYMLI